MLYIRHLTKYYTRHKPVISDLNLTFDSRGLNIIVGKSGCGKTTLLNLIGTMDQDYIGSIELDGVELSKLNPDQIADYRNYESAYIFQLNSLFEHMTVRENIEMVLNLQSKKETDIDAILDKVGLSGFANKKVKYLSGGEKQRVGIARAIAKDAKIILADEPTSALDSKNAHRILALFKEISKEKLVIVVTHDTKKAFRYADRIIKLVDGRVVEDDVINRVEGDSPKITRKPPKAKVLRPIFFHQLRKSLLVNFFIILLCSFAIATYNIEKEQSKILKDYNDYYETGYYKFNDLKALSIHEANQINFYNVVRAKDDDTMYKYFQKVENRIEPLTQEDISNVEKIFKNANIHYGDSSYGKVIIDDISATPKFSETYQGTQYIWSEKQRTDYGYYVYNENNDYNIIYGRRPENDNEILITDVVADHFLSKNEFVGYNIDSIIGTELVIGDIYYISPNPVDSRYLYHHTTPKTYVIAGIIGTNQLDFYSYEINTDRYMFKDGIVRAKDDIYLNSVINRPFGYIVLPNYLDAYKTYKFYEADLRPYAIKYSDKVITNTKLRTFHGFYDYRGIKGYEDDIVTDVNKRILIKDSDVTKLTGNQVIVSMEMLRKIFPDYTSENLIRTNYLSEISGTEFTLSFTTDAGITEYTFVIAGVSKTHSDEPLMFISEEFYDIFKYENTVYDNTSIAVELSGLNARERIKLIKEAYKYGLVLIPQYSAPGPYMEFVETQGEVLLVDDEGYEEETNISVYYLYSKFYNTDEMNGLNYTLEIISSVYVFVLFMAVSLSLGLVYLKERRQKMEIRKLSQVGVYTKSMIRMNFISYIIIAIGIGALSFFATELLINIINSKFTIHVGEASIYRFRILMTNTSLVSAIVGFVLTLIIGLISSNIIVKKSRR